MAETSQMQSSRNYAQAFGRGVYTDILRWGDSETLTSLCRRNRFDIGDTYLNCLHRFYKSMKCNYRCEYVFKNEIIADLRHHYAGHKTLVVNEFRVGNSIADLAFFNGESRAYEIKTSFDSPRRLMSQMNSYRRVFDKCYLVVERDEVEDWLHYDDNMGIIAFSHGSRGGVRLDEFRHAKLNKCLDAETIMSCLRAEEYEWIAMHYANMELTSPKYKHFEECTRILKKMNYELLHKAFLETIELRKSDFDILKYTPRELYQVCLSMHLTENQLDIITNSLKNKII
mgnify:CR=1 FL=1